MRVGDTPVRMNAEQDAGGFGWDGRFPCQQAVSKSAILTTTEMHAGRAPRQSELDAIVAFVNTIDVPNARPGVDFDPALAAVGQRVFTTARPVVDQGGEFAVGQSVACATCHTGLNLTDRKFHRILASRGDPAADPGRVDPDGSAGDQGLTPPAVQIGEDPTLTPPGLVVGHITGFKTPALRGLRLTAPYFHEGLAGDPSGAAHNTGRGSFDRQAARSALFATVVFYNERFAFGFTTDEELALVEYLMSL
jgi:hypothetical protein